MESSQDDEHFPSNNRSDAQGTEDEVMDNLGMVSVWCFLSLVISASCTCKRITGGYLGASNVQSLNASDENLSFVKPGEKSPSDGFIVRSKACKPCVLASSEAQAPCQIQAASQAGPAM